MLHRRTLEHALSRHSTASSLSVDHAGDETIHDTQSGEVDTHGDVRFSRSRRQFVDWLDGVTG